MRTETVISPEGVGAVITSDGDGGSEMISQEGWGGVSPKGIAPFTPSL